MAYFDLGTHSQKVTAATAEAQTWFDRGLVWTYGYNHEEAIACFRRALDADPGCAMARWGIAYAIGPNYNKGWADFEDDEKPAAIETARAAVAAAAALRDRVTPLEAALIDAVARRYPETADVEDYAPWHDAYADAMRKVHRAHGDDGMVCALFAEALMNRTPWQLWDLPGGRVAEGADTEEAIGVLETAFDTIPGAWQNPGLLHMYIHLMEMSPHPEKALRHGDALATLVPDAGHLVHMATHIDVLCGDYQNTVSRNAAAIVADLKFLDREGPDNFYTIYRCHNYHFKIYGAMFLGQATPALETADALVASLPEPVLRPLADWLESFIPMKQHALIRFGRWEEILAQDLPEDRELYCFTTALMRYARAVALANAGDPSGAADEADRFEAAAAAVPDSRMLFNNTCRDVLGIAREMMQGEIAYHAGRHDEAFARLRRAVELDDNMPYDEPWGWMQPARHALGALLLDQGRHDEAEAVYRADLGLDDTLARACQHPGNVWSLHGLHECLARRGEKAERAQVRLQLDKAIARAEVPIRASCFCRQGAAA